MKCLLQACREVDVTLDQIEVNRWEWGWGVAVEETVLKNAEDDDDILRHLRVCWCSDCAAWTETRPCRSQVCGSSSGHPCTSPVIVLKKSAHDLHQVMES